MEITNCAEAKTSKIIKEEEEVVDKIISLKSLGPILASKNNSRNTIYFHDIPEVCKHEPCVLGVDEAGRGPVLGPMVYGIAFCPLARAKALVDLGCADSKQLSEDKREAIFDEMHIADYARSCLGWAVELLSPNVISMCMYKRAKCSLNEISMNSAIGLIHQAIDAGVNIVEVYVDTVGPPEKYQEKLQGIFPQFKITVAKKADSTYPIVSAASICAKVTRDHALKVWQFHESGQTSNFGSGYPGDPTTKRFLNDSVDLFFGFPRLVRFSWSTAEKALAGRAYPMEFDEPEKEKPNFVAANAKTAKMTSFYKGTTREGNSKRTLCRFLRERYLQTVDDF